MVERICDRDRRRCFWTGLILWLALAGGALGPAAAAGAATGARAGAGIGAGAPDESDRVVLSGGVHPRLRGAADLGRSAPGLTMNRMVLSLALRPGGRADLDRLLALQADPASPLYRQWLTPAQFAARFGATDEAVHKVANWLARHGFTVDEIARGHGWINFSGTAQQVEEAFATEMHDYRIDGIVHHANALDPSIPRALAGIVTQVVSLADFRSKPLHYRRQPSPAAGAAGRARAVPNATYNGSNYLAPADFATIYDLGPSYSANLTGSGQAIAIVARTDIQLADVEEFRSQFGLPANDPIVVHNGPPPGDLGDDEETEADLDTEWSGAVAPHAAVYLVVSASTLTTDGVLLSAQYIVDNNLAPVMSTSFGSCEADLGPELSFLDSLWAQAAAQGITSLVASGDSGASGCDEGFEPAGSGLAVSGFCSPPNDVCVGGTEFMDTAAPAAYWASAPDPTTQGSALSYIPEMAWNESGNVAGGNGLWSTGGGVSSVFPWALQD